MEFDYYKLYLQNYLREHSFDKRVVSSPVVGDNADLATTEFANARRAGYSITGAGELALQTLFVGIGASQKETASDFLEDWFKERVMLNGYDSFVEWRDKLAAEDSIWQPYLIENGIGLNEETVEAHKNEIIYDIDQFLIKNGL